MSYLCKAKLQIALLMSTKICHSGVVDQVGLGSVRVRIVQTSTCAACKVKGYCNAAESKEKLIDVFCGDSSSYHVGQSVVVSTSGDVAGKALLWAFGLPFVVLVLVLIVVQWLTSSEGLAALSALAALIPYYFVLWLMRDRMRERLRFWIES